MHVLPSFPLTFPVIVHCLCPNKAEMPENKNTQNTTQDYQNVSSRASTIITSSLHHPHSKEFLERDEVKTQN